MSEDKVPYDAGKPGNPANPQPTMTEFDIGFLAGSDEEVMLIHVPVGEYSRDAKNGIAMFYGKMREAEAIGCKVIKERRIKAQMANGIIRHPALPPGIPPPGKS